MTDRELTDLRNAYVLAQRADRESADRDEYKMGVFHGLRHALSIVDRVWLDEQDRIGLVLTGDQF